MLTQHVKINEGGRRIGESHPRAILSDHEARLLFALLDEREELINQMLAEDAKQADIDKELTARHLSYRCLAEKFEISKGHVGKVARGDRRCQTPVRWACP